MMICLINMMGESGADARHADDSLDGALSAVVLAMMNETRRRPAIKVRSGMQTRLGDVARASLPTDGD